MPTRTTPTPAPQPEPQQPAGVDSQQPITPEGTQQPSEQQQPTTDTTTEPDTTEPKGRTRDAGSEAAQRRHQLREAEAQRDALAGQLEHAHRQIVEQLVAEGLHTLAGPRQLHTPADLFDVGGRDVSDFVAEDGSIDRDAVSTALAELHTQRPYLFEAPSLRDPIGVGLGNFQTGTRSGVSDWASALRSSRNQ